MTAQAMDQVKVAKPQSVTPARGVVLQRKCACGGTPGPTGECAECQKKRMALQRKEANSSTPSEVPPIVHEVLRSSGQPLESGTREFMESRFSHNFSQVRVHTDSRAVESAQAVDALAYTVGNHVIFNENQYHQNGVARQQLLSHELVHVMQQKGLTGLPSRIDPSPELEEQARTLSHSAHGATISLQRTVSSTNCSTGRHGVSVNDNPNADITAAESRARGFSHNASIQALLAGTDAFFDEDITETAVGQAFEARFGLPEETQGRFQNRFTRELRPTLAQAIGGELVELSNRLESISRILDRPKQYHCMSNPTIFAGCDTHCVDRSASACHGINVMFLCPSFWQITEDTRTSLLIHESVHILIGNAEHSVSGRLHNFRHPECLASFVSDLFGLPTNNPSCPTP
jgi:Domain of unknown function (DUF4157)